MSTIERRITVEASQAGGRGASRHGASQRLTQNDDLSSSEIGSLTLQSTAGSRASFMSNCAVVW
jgi:hypothetical protein